MKIDLQIEPKGHPYYDTVRRWKKGEPFILNPRAVLVHRVRSVITFLNDDGTWRHHAAHYLCGNSTCFHDFSAMLSEPPDDRLVCARCEEVARRNGLPSSSELAGRHVHVGELRAHRLCCHNEGN